MRARELEIDNRENLAVCVLGVLGGLPVVHNDRKGFRSARLCVHRSTRKMRSTSSLRMVDVFVSSDAGSYRGHTPHVTRLVHR